MIKIETEWLQATQKSSTNWFPGGQLFRILADKVLQWYYTWSCAITVAFRRNNIGLLGTPVNIDPSR